MVAGADVVDANECLVMPGFVDTHRHIWQTALRAICAECSLKEYMRGIRFQRAKVYRPPDVYAGNYAGMLEALNAGVTTVFDFSHCINTPEYAAAAIEGLQDAGGRAIFGYGFNEVPLDEPYFVKPEQRSDLARRLRKETLASDDALVTMGVSLSDLLVSGIDRAGAELATGRELGVKISLHSNCFMARDSQSEVAILKQRGLLGPDLLWVHVNLASDDELQAIVDSGGAISATPETEMQMGMGHPITGRFMAAGGRISFGADIVSGGSGDMFFHMRLALQTERMLQNDRTLARGYAPERIELSARTILRAATLGGAEAVGLQRKIGSLEVGKEADIILIRLDEINTMPVNDPVGTVVMHAHPGNVNTVFVGGKIIKRGGKMLVDMDRLRKLLHESHDYLSNAIRAIDPSIPATYVNR
jgi:5-methylthioadenosine/S-adenosylhomocysteine deaminase